MKLLKSVIAISVMASAFIISGCSSDYKPSDNTGFAKIKSPQSNADITMIFWYRCPACYKAERILTPWADKNDVSIEYRHSAIWEDDAKLFYTLDLMGKAQDNQTELMEYFRHASNPKLKDISDIVSEGITEEKIRKRLDSQHVKNRIIGTRLYEQSIGSTGVPLIIVGNKYALINEGMSSQHMTETINYLISNGALSQSPQ